MRRYSKHLVPCTVPASRVRERDIGGKALRLFELRGGGFPVPPWFVLSSRTFTDLTNGTRSQIASSIEQINYGDRESIRRASAEIADRIRTLRVPEKLIRDITDMRHCVLGHRSNVSVRSSAVGEDSKQHSFAGQLSSYLNISDDRIPEAITNVWISTFSERVLVYRHEEGLHEAVSPTAVIVQQMVDSQVSGVMFTHDPEDGRQECIITAGYGWGEGVVQDLVEIDTYRIGWASDDVAKAIAVKRHQVIAAPSGSSIAAVPKDQQQRAALTDEQVRCLRTIGLRAVEYFRGPQDIEWAIDRDGSIHILQARPIVYRARRADRESIRVWDNANIVESYPGLTLPLTFSFIRDCYESTFLAAALGFVVRKGEMRRHRPVFANMIGLLRGRVYYNLLNWYTMLSFLPGLNDHKNAWDQMIGIRRKVQIQRTKMSFINRMACVFSILYRLLAVRRTAAHFFTRFRVSYRKFRNIDVTALSLENLADLYDTMASDFGSSWHLTLYNDFAAMKYYDWLKRLCGMQRLRSHINLHNDLLCGRADIESVEPVESLAKLTELFRSDPLLQTFTQPGDDAAAWTQIMQDPRLRAIKKALQSHIDKYGDRGLGELKLENPTLREEPATLIHQVRVWSQTESNPDELRRREFEIRERANTTVRQQIRNPAMRAVFWFVLRNARRGISNRENMRFARTRVYGLFRKLFQQLGQVLAANETIGASSDIHYLTVGEVLALIRGANVTHDVRALIEIRKSEYAQFATESLPNRLETSAVPCQEQLSEVPDAVRHGNELSGIGCSSGLADGAAVIVDDPQTVDVAEDSILIAASTDPGWVFLMTRCKGIVVERGSLLSHTAIIGRELGIPTIVGADGAQGLIPRGAHVHMDGGTGVVQWN